MVVNALETIAEGKRVYAYLLVFAFNHCIYESPSAEINALTMRIPPQEIGVCDNDSCSAEIELRLQDED